MSAVWRTLHPALRKARRLVVAIVGTTVLLTGTAFLVLPGPALLVIPLGLAILASEFVWARHLLERVRAPLAGASPPIDPVDGEAGHSEKLDVLVMAGMRGSEDAFVRAAGAKHRALISVAGRPLLAHVLDALRAFPRIGAIHVSIDERGKALARDALAQASGSPPDAWLTSAASPARSVLAALDAGARVPLLVTTADHALLSADILRAFLAEAETHRGDVVVGVVPKAAVETRYPETRRTGLHFAGEALCGANLFLLRRPASRAAVAFWLRVENDRKHPLRMVRHFGWWATLCFAVRRLSFERALRVAGKRMGIEVDAARIAIPEAAIDVDNMADLELADEILRRRAR